MFLRAKFVAVSAFVLLLAACGSGADDPGDGSVGGSQESASATRQAARLEQGGERDLPVQMQLILGTLQLENSDLAVDSKQAAELIPLWRALRSLSNSDTAAEAEIEALINQIQDTMTAEQIEAIASLDLSDVDLRTMIQDLGIEFGSPEGFGEDGFQFQPGTFPGGGGEFGGGPFGGGGGGPQGGFQGGDGNFDPDAAATARAEAGFSGIGRRGGGFLIEPLIELLEQRAGLESTT
ncbi:MAG: hypothetical protein V3U32_00525 [Anaerolineales bacterium]